MSSAATRAMTSAADSREHYRREFAAAAPLFPGNELPWLIAARRRALEQFLARGFPTLRDEDWKYTSVAAIEKSRFRLIGPAPQPAWRDIEGLALPDAHLMVFVDGRFSPALSRLGDLPDGATIAGIAETLRQAPQRLEAHLGNPGDAEGGAYSAFTALNTAFLADGAYIHLGRDVALAAPVQLLFVAASGERASHTRTIVVAEAGSRVELLEQHVALPGAESLAYLSNCVTDIAAHEGARVAHHKLQQEGARAYHIAAIGAVQGRASEVLSASFALGGALARIGIDIALEAEEARCELLGLYLAGGRQHVDHHTRVDHKQPRGVSRELYKGVLAGLSRAVFNGKVIVHPDAQKSDAQQSNRNLLLSEHAEIDTKPQLEIYADDVKCSHGATVGQLDSTQLFYLRSRGVDEEAARALLTYGFAEEVVASIGNAVLRERLEQALRQRLPQAMQELL